MILPPVPEPTVTIPVTFAVPATFIPVPVTTITLALPTADITPPVVKLAPVTLPVADAEGPAIFVFEGACCAKALPANTIV